MSQYIVYLSQNVNSLFFGDQLVGNGISIGAEIGGVHGVRIVIIKIGVLDFHYQHAGKIGTDPIQVEFINEFWHS